MKCSLKIVKYMLIMGIALNVPLMSYAKCSSHHSCKDDRPTELCRKGKKGDRGKKGKKGDEGPRGNRGRTGKTGRTGDVGPEGDPGLPGNPPIVFAESCYSHLNQTLDAGDFVVFDTCVIPRFPSFPGGDTITIPAGITGLASLICEIRGFTEDETDPAFFEILLNGNPVLNSPVNSHLAGDSPNALLVVVPVSPGDRLQFVSMNDGVSLREDLPAANAKCQLLVATPPSLQ